MAKALEVSRPVQMDQMNLGEAMERLRQALTWRKEPNPLGKAWRLMELLGVSPEEALAHPERPLTSEQNDQLSSLIERIGEGEPFAYLVGEVDFCGLTFKVDQRAFIPRRETELVVEATLSHLTKSSEGVKILDLGTGSGCIGITLARKLSGAKVWLVDISAEALALAKDNARRLGVLDRVRLIHWDFFTAPPAEFSKLKLDVLVSNPPYVDERNAHLLAPEVRRFEPEIALFGVNGKTGFTAFHRLVELGQILLRPGGLLVFEVGVGQGERAFRLLKEGGYKEVEMVPESQGRVRVVVGVRG